MDVRRGSNRALFMYLDQLLHSSEQDRLRWMKRPLRTLLRGLVVVVGNFQDNNCLLRASALSFTTILSLVPFLAFAFAILKGFGVQNALEPIIVRHLALGSGDMVARIISYINNTKVASLGAIGLIVLVFTVISLLGSIEDTFNSIWGVAETRTAYRKFSDYLSVVVVGPILLLAAVSITTSLQSQNLVRWLLETAYFGDVVLFCFQLIPYISIWLALVCLYSFLPNTRVSIVSALLGGVIAGTVWQSAQWGYVHFQVGVAKYNAIYGTLAALPVFMVWMYVSWVIVLFGAEIVVAHQSRRTLLNDFLPEDLSWRASETTALVVFLTVAVSLYRQEQPWTAERLADARRLPLRTVRHILSQLVAVGCLAVVEHDHAYLPAKDLEQVRIDTFLKDFRSLGEDFPARDGDPFERMVRNLMERYEAGGAHVLAGMTVKDLVQEMLPGEPDVSPDSVPVS